MYPELSPQGRYHLHGKIKFKKNSSIVLFYLNLADLKDVAMEIDTIKDMDIWEKYCTKQSNLHKYLIKYMSITVPYVYTARVDRSIVDILSAGDAHRSKIIK